MRLPCLLIPLLGAAACGGSQKPTTPHAASATRAQHPHGEAERPVDIERAALPFYVLARGGNELDEVAFYDQLAAADAVCIGERHPNPHHHWAQLHVFRQLSERARARGATLALGMEMFQRPFQAVLDDYARGAIDDAELLSRSGWKKRWGYSFDLYRPMLALAVASGHALIAINASDEIRDSVRERGVEGLTGDERATVPELKLDDAEHRAWFDGIMSGHPGGDEAESGHSVAGDDIYRMQVLWDETMADAAASWLRAGDGEQRQIVILAGNGHCHDSAVVRRIARRGVERVVSIEPLIDDGESSVADAVAEKNNDYLLVMTLPEGVERADD